MNINIYNVYNDSSIAEFSLTFRSQHQFDFRIKHLFKYQDELWLTSFEGSVISFDGYRQIYTSRLRKDFGLLRLLPNYSLDAPFI